MYKIPLEVGNDGITLPSGILISRYHVNLSQIFFLIDTGSTASFISPDDVERIHIPINSLQVVDNMKIGGASSDLMKIEGVELLIKEENGKLIHLKVAEFRVASKGKRKKDKEGFPSILGIDFLHQYRIKLVYNGNLNEAYMEIEEQKE